MKLTSPFTHLICCSVLLANSGLAQVVVTSGQQTRTPQAYQQLVANTNKLQVTLQLDRQEYFPHEDASLTLTITNPGDAPLEVIEPLVPRTGGTNVYFHDSAKPASDPRSWHRISPHENGVAYFEDRDVPTAWVLPGQSVTKKCLLSDIESRAPLDAQGRRTVTVCQGFHMMSDEGDYQNRYNYGRGAVADFRVVWPQFGIDGAEVSSNVAGWPPRVRKGHATFPRHL